MVEIDIEIVIKLEDQKVAQAFVRLLCKQYRHRPHRFRSFSVARLERKAENNIKKRGHPKAYLIGCDENDLFEIGGKEYTGKQFLSALNTVLGVCKKCGEPRAKGSNSYCREHERERLKKWRLNRAKANI